MYSRAVAPAALRVHLRSREEFKNFTKYHVLALRSVMDRQVLRWNIPSPKKAKRYALKADVTSVLKENFLQKKGFDRPADIANNLIAVVAKCVFDDVRQSVPRLRPSYDNRPILIFR